MKIIIPLAEGFEEIEAVTSIDLLRRGEIEVTTVALAGNEVKGAHGIVIKADQKISAVQAADYDGIVLPGGMPGSVNLRDNQIVINLVSQLFEQNKLVAAICAAPIVLEKAGILRGKQATSYPNFDQEMPSCDYREERVVLDQNIITGRGPGVALEFSLAIVQYLSGEEKAGQLKKALLV